MGHSVRADSYSDHYLQFSTHGGANLNDLSGVSGPLERVLRHPRCSYELIWAGASPRFPARATATGRRGRAGHATACDCDAKSVP